MKGLQEFYLNTEGGGEAGDSSGGAVPSDGGSVGADVSTSEHVNPDGGVVPEAPATENSAEGTWFEKATPEQAAFIKNKGWGDDPLRAIAGYRELEKFVGKDPERVLELPREDDPEGAAAFWQKLGAFNQLQSQLNIDKTGEGVRFWFGCTVEDIQTEMVLSRMVIRARI